MESLGVLIPSRARPDILEECLFNLSSFDRANILDVVIVSDDHDETFEFARKFSRRDIFRKYTVIQAPERLYPVKAFNFTLENCESELFCWLADDAVFPKFDWISKVFEVFLKMFPDNIGVLGMHKDGPGLGASSKSFVKYNGEFYHSGYNVHYADMELGMKALMLGRYTFLGEGVGHQRLLLEKRPPMDLKERYEFIRKDKILFSERKNNKFYIDKRKLINPIELNLNAGFHWEHISMPLPKGVS